MHTPVGYLLYEIGVQRDNIKGWRETIKLPFGKKADMSLLAREASSELPLSRQPLRYFNQVPIATL
jgi:hypothetical protein